MKWKSTTCFCVLILCTLSACKASSTGSVEKGDAFLKQGKTAEALIEFRRAVQANPKDGQARLRLGQTYRSVGDVARWVEQAVRAADLLPDSVEAQLEASRALLSAGRFEDASTRAEKVIKAAPTNVDGHLLRATAAAGMRDVAGAIDVLTAAAKLDPNRSETIVDLAALQSLQGKKAEAEAGFRQAVTVAPKSVGPRLALAGFLWNTERRPEAEKVLLEAIAIEPTNVSANQALAGLYRSTGRAALAEEPLKRIAEATKRPEHQLALADYYVAEKRVADARAILTSLAKSPEAAAAAQGRLAGIEYVAGNRDLAYKMLDAVIAKDPGNVGLLVVRTGWRLSEGKLSEAREAAEKATKTDPKAVDAWTLLGAVCESQNDTAEAIRAYTSALQLRPNAFEAHVALTRLYLSTGRLEEAGESARQAVAIAPNRIGPRHAMARVLFETGQVKEAEQEVKTLLAIAPNSTELLGLSGLIRQRRGDAVGARKDFERVIQLEPKSLEGQLGLARLDFAAKRPQDALKRLSAVAGKEQRDSKLLLLSGRAQEATGDNAGAEQSYHKALQADPTLTEAYDALGQLLIKTKRLEDARQAYERQATSRPNDIAAHTMVAKILWAQGKPKESRERFETILSIDPRAPIASNNLAYMDAEAGTNLEIALNRAQTAKAAMPNDPDVDDTLGWVYVKRGLPALSFAPLRQAIQKTPTNPLYHYHLGVAYAKSGDTAHARTELTEALRLSSSFENAADAKRLLETLGN